MAYPFDMLMLSTGRSVSGIAKQHMIKHLRRTYSTVVHSSMTPPGSQRVHVFQKIGAVHILKNCEYWSQHRDVASRYDLSQSLEVNI